MGEYHSLIRRLVWIAAMTAVMEAAKWALNAFANVELISLLTIIYTVWFGWRTALTAVLLFAGIECLWWGISVWTITYFYVWPLLVLLSAALAKGMDKWKAAVLSCLFGYAFGALCALVTLVLHGPAAAIAWWAAGIPYDLIHGTANLIIAFVLYDPLMNALRHIPKE